MGISFLLLQFGVSLLAIFALAGLALLLRLGRDVRIANTGEAQDWANQVCDGFEAQEIAIDRRGTGAVLSNAAGQIMLLKPHGGHFVGRILNHEANAATSVQGLIVNSGERRFGSVSIDIKDAKDWASAINALGNASDA